MVRLVVGAVLPATLVALAVVPAVGLRSRLPEPMASHWGLSGSADGSMPVSAFVAGVLLFSLVPAAAAMVVSRQPLPGRSPLGWPELPSYSPLRLFWRR